MKSSSFRQVTEKSTRLLAFIRAQLSTRGLTLESVAKLVPEPTLVPPVISAATFRDEDGVPVRFPHIGKVIVDDECEIGCNTTIARGNLQDTRLHANVKIDDQVYIAHNCEIGNSTMIAGGATVCGGVVIGSHCWIGAGAMIRQGIEIGAKAIVGLGAVVVNTVAADTIVAGNPARLKREE